MDTKINNAIKQVLEQFGDKYFIEGVLNKSKVIQDLDGYNRELLAGFVSDEVLRSHFTMEVYGKVVIQTNKLIDLFEADEYWKDSYTRYSKKIGLTTGGNFIDEATDVVLDFPYKDTVLKATMSKEDTDKGDLHPDEPFLNEIIAKEEIDTLLDKKILVNAKRYDENGEHEITSFNEDDNLIMKGNNLLALHTLKDKYAGKVKLIYIDPPYNTGKDAFNYNDKFNHSAWLTFIKNRLEVAWEMLSVDGTIWISIDDYESHYLKVLADNVFGRENYLNEVIWQRAYAPINLKKTFSRSHDSILVYAKNNSSDKELNRIPRKESMTSSYKNPDDDPRGPYKADNFSVGPAVERNIYEITTPSGRKVMPPAGRSWLFSKERYNELLNDNRVYFGKDGNSMPAYKRFLSEVKDGVVAQTLWTYQEVGHNQDAKKEIKKLFEGKSVFDTPKPEKFIQRIITLGSDEGDLILDFFMGSSTTQAVAQKMNRQYIGIEQMDYINTVSIPRLRKVIEGEQGGVSEEVKWEGGGSFVYAELMEKNRGFLKAIQDVETQTDLNNLLEFMLEEAEIDFRVDLEEVKKSLNELSFNEQKKTLLKIIDKNQLYYNYSEINDENVRDLIEDNDYAFNLSFYDSGGES